MHVEMLKNQFLGIGYGTSMTNTDMVVFLGDPSNPEVRDLFAIGHVTP